VKTIGSKPAAQQRYAIASISFLLSADDAGDAQIEEVFEFVWLHIVSELDLFPWIDICVHLRPLRKRSPKVSLRPTFNR
jgi:hypothetical protein